MKRKAKRLKKTATLTDILTQGSLGVMQSQSRLNDRLKMLLDFYLDAAQQPHVSVSSYREGTLTLMTDNSSLVGQLRYLSHIYKQRLGQHPEFCELKRIQVLLSPTTSNFDASHPRKRPPARRLKPETAELIKRTADNLGGGKVSEALYRLASFVLQPPADQYSKEDQN